MVHKISVLLVSDGYLHPTLIARAWLRRALQAMSGYHIRQVASLEVLAPLAARHTERPLPVAGTRQSTPRQGALAPNAFQGIVLYFHHRSLSPSALEGLRTFVSEGGGLLALHSASASFKHKAQYFEILGGRFKNHGPIEPILVQPTRRPDEVFGELSCFTVRDELYLHECAPGIRVHFHTPIDGEFEPLVWTHSFGRGRVCYCALGHKASTMRHPQVQTILKRGLEWVCGCSDRKVQEI